MITDAIKGVRPAAFSIVTDAELWAGVKSQESDRQCRLVLRNLQRLFLSLEIARAAGRLREKNRNIFLPDAIIAATAMHHSLPLCTRNPKDYRDIDGLEIVTYKLTKDE